MALLEKEMIKGSNSEDLGVPIMKDYAAFEKGEF